MFRGLEAEVISLWQGFGGLQREIENRVGKDGHINGNKLGFCVKTAVIFMQPVAMRRTKFLDCLIFCVYNDTELGNQTKQKMFCYFKTE